MRSVPIKYFRLALAVALLLVFPLADYSQNTICTGSCGQPTAECSHYCYARCHKGMCGMATCVPGHRHK